jgi:hypothetical protein
MQEEEKKVYAVDRRKDLLKFDALCEENRRLHQEAIAESYARLVDAGVPEQYIFVIQANRDDPQKKGDLFSYSNKQRLEETLGSVQRDAQMCFSPDVFVFLCTDVRDQTFMAQYLDSQYFEQTWFKEMIAEYCDL